VSDEADDTECGRAFQARAAATGNTRSPSMVYFSNGWMWGVHVQLFKDALITHTIPEHVRHICEYTLYISTLPLPLQVCWFAVTVCRMPRMPACKQINNEICTSVCASVNRRNCTTSWRKLHWRSRLKLSRSLSTQLTVNVKLSCSWHQISSLVVTLLVSFLFLSLAPRRSIRRRTPFVCLTDARCWLQNGKS